jgi:hypothetical protein
MNDSLKAAIEKVAKLRALAARAGTQAEAEAAAAQAAAIVAKYQIDEAVLEAHSPERAEEIQEGDPLWSGERDISWLNMLAAGIGKIHGCAVIVRRYGGAATVTYIIVGRPSDLAIVRYLFAWLHAEIVRLSESERGRTAKNAFRVGAAVGVIDAMRKARAVEAGIAPTSAAMVLASRADQAMAWLTMQSGRKLHAARRFSVTDASGAYDRGRAKGSALTPNAALGSTTHRALPR